MQATLWGISLPALVVGRRGYHRESIATVHGWIERVEETAVNTVWLERDATPSLRKRQAIATHRKQLIDGRRMF